MLRYSLTHWHVVSSDPPLVMKAMARSAESQLSIWDSTVFEAALVGGAQALYSGDFTEDQQLGPLRMVNPFSTRR